MIMLSLLSNCKSYHVITVTCDATGNDETFIEIPVDNDDDGVTDMFTVSCCKS